MAPGFARISDHMHPDELCGSAFPVLPIDHLRDDLNGLLGFLRADEADDEFVAPRGSFNTDGPRIRIAESEVDVLLGNGGVQLPGCA